MSNRKSRRGSAYLIALGILSVLVIVVFMYSRTSIARRWSTKFMTSEQNAEAVAEAAIDLKLLIVREQMNPDPANLSTPLKEWGEILRSPGKLSNNGSELSAPNGTDIPIDADNPSFQATTQVVNTKGGATGDLAPLQSLIDTVPGSLTVWLDSRISSASAFAAKDGGFHQLYHVVGINKQSLPVSGDPAKFLDGLSNVDSNCNTVSTQLISDYKLNLRLPNWPSLTDSHTMMIDVPFFPNLPIDITLDILDGQPSDHLRIVATIPLFGFEVGKFEFNIYDQFLKKFLDGDTNPSTPPKKFYAQDFAETVVAAPNTWKQFIWSSSRIVPFISNAFANLPARIKTNIPSTGIAPEMIVEKTGLIKLTATVFYQPHLGGETIKKILSAERDFKVSDIQPIAPEYVFFVANSKWPYENTADAAATENDVYQFSPTSTGITMATNTVHPFPKDPTTASISYAMLKDAFSSSGTVSNKTHLPGMLRLNGTNPSNINVFSGTLEELKSTMYNVFFVNKKGTAPNDVYGVVDPRFNWKSPLTSNAWTLPYIPFPVGYTNPKGFLAMFDILKNHPKLDSPMLFFGDFAAEYPLSLRLEGNILMNYSSMVIQVEPIIDAVEIAKAIRPKLGIPPFTIDVTKIDKAKADVSDITCIHTVKSDLPFGVHDFPAWDSTTPPATAWDPVNRPESMPANLYSPLQYAKKATYYYANESDFLADMPNHGGAGDFQCDGVFFIKGSVTLPAMTIYGRGLIIASQNITTEGDIVRKANTDTVFGLIARGGSILNGGITAGKEAKRIEAACYSNYTLQNTGGSKLTIDGNLVINHFDRALMNSVIVFYNGPACRNTLLSMIRDVGKYEPLRYYVALGKQWARFEYEKR
ncbi:MAG: hypothetical protein HQM09_05745 [Candidatus Riflebacteria bacterium]|nr:hypothetical protein [Candidatus Riflebacteria bacterium]